MILRAKPRLKAVCFNPGLKPGVSNANLDGLQPLMININVIFAVN